MAVSHTLRHTASLDLAHHPVLKDLLKNIATEQNRTPKVFPAWDIVVVLQALTRAPFEPLASASDKILTYKTVFLLALATGKRRSELHAFLFSRFRRGPQLGICVFCSIVSVLGEESAGEVWFQVRLNLLGSGVIPISGT